MATIWIVSEDPTLPEDLAHHLSPLGACWVGAPERSAWRGAPDADLVVLPAREDERGDAAQLERLLAFLSDLTRLRRAPAPVLYLEPAGGFPTADRIRRLVDDRPVRTLGWPLDTDALLDLAGELLETPAAPLSVRERKRRAWVTARVELCYADLDLPQLRRAVDPRNAGQPILLAGESGTRRGLLARYIHGLSEPERDRLVPLAAASLAADGLEERLLASAGRDWVTLYLENIDRLDEAAQSALAELLGSSGTLAVEPIRWIASVERVASLAAALRALPWIRVDLPPLRDRANLEALVGRYEEAWIERSGRSVRLTADAKAAMERYAWPGNLRELEQALEPPSAAAGAEEIGPDDLRFGARLPGQPSALRPQQAAPAGTEQPAVEVPQARKLPVAAREPELPTPVEPLVEPEAAAATAEEPRTPPTPSPRWERPGLAAVVPALAHEIRQPVLAIRTYTSLLEQRPDDEGVRNELTAMVEEDLGRLDKQLQQLERYTSFGEPAREPFDLAAAVGAELDRRQDRIRSASLIALRELEQDAPPLVGDEQQLRFAVGMILDRALRMIPRGGDLYVGSLYHPAQGSEPPRHRLLIRFQSPEEVLLGPDEGPEPALPLEVLLARDLIQRAGGSFAVDSTGAQDNVVLIELH